MKLYKSKPNLQISLGAKITLTITSLVLASISIATVASLKRNNKLFHQQLEREANILLTTLNISTADSFYSSDIELIQDIFDELAWQKSVIASHAYRQDGRIIAGTTVKDEEKLSLAPDPLGKKLLATQTTLFEWQQNRLIAGKSIRFGDRAIGALSVELSTAPLKEKLAAERNKSLLLAAILAIITSLIASHFSRFITEPLKQMITATQYLAGGDLEYKMVISSNDELATLARAFNYMTAELKNTVDNLEERAEALYISETVASDKALELKITLDRLKQAKAAAERANKAKSIFLSNMSHELRTPLNGILGYAQILQRDRGLTPQQSNGLKIIYESGNHLLTLINDILDLSKIEARKLELYPSKLHCQSFLNNIGDIVRMQALEKDIFFECCLDPKLPTGIEADEKRLRQVLLNLLGNAIKFTDRGKVTLKVSLTRERIRGDSSRQMLRFEVIDTGVGIETEKLDQIFQPFKQVGNVKRREAGTGLGLAISTQLVALMDGQIGVKSQLGEGSTFWFDVVFPVTETVMPASISELRQEVVGYRGKRRKILVVDDKQENRLVVSNMLQPLGFEIILAEDGQQEVNLAQEIKPDCILTDLVMPVKSGFEAVKEIRKIPEIKDVIIIAISASVLDLDRKKSRIAGCEAFLPKPIHQRQLLALLQEYLELDWIYEEIELPAQDESASNNIVAAKDLITPPEAEVEILYELAMLGSMKKIRERADLLEELDKKYAPFAHKLRELAKSFQEKAIVSLIEELL